MQEGASSMAVKEKKRKFRTISCCFAILAVLPSSIVRGGGGRLVAIIAAFPGGTPPARMSRRTNAGGGANFSSFASAAPATSSPLPRRTSSAVLDAATPSYAGSSAERPSFDGECSSSPTSSWSSHPDDPSLWIYHVETTTSTMDEARRIVEGKFALDRADDDASLPTSFLVSATTQSNGRGTANRNWEGSRGGNALLTIGVPQASWMDGLRSRNDGRAVPLTLLPLKVGSLVAYHTRRALRECVPRLDDDGAAMPAVTVKWPNDVLLRVDDEVGDDGSSSSSGPSHEKIAGILVETSRDWFLVGIGINIGYAPHVPSEGNNRGRKATCLARYCRVDGEVEDGSSEDDATAIEGGEERHWIEASRKLATDVAYDLHSWLHSDARRHHSGESILEDWKSYVDWDMELTLRDTPNMERVTLEGVLEDGRAVVKEVETGLTRTLVSDYFL